MKAFRVANEASAAKNLGKTMLMTISFWLAFLVLAPWLITQVESRLGIPFFRFSHQTLAAGALFGVMASINLSSGVLMAVIGRGTPFPADTARELVIRGPYRFVRNPMAVGGLGLGLAVAIYLGSYATIAYVIAGGLLWNLIARPMEEADLSSRFGDDYVAYKSAVRCWIPRLRPYRTDSSRP